jgi:hypothetical protein
MALAGVLFPVVAASAATATVCASGCDFSTITAAVTAANPGDTILVGPGTYYESNILINKPLTIEGLPGGIQPGPAVGAPIIDGGGQVADAFDLANGVHDVVITGFEIRNYAANDWTNGTGVGVQAWVPSTQNVTVSHNWFHDVGYGVMAGNDGSSPKYALGTHSGWTVEDNIAEGIYSIAFELTDASDSVVQSNLIHLGVRDTLYGFGAIGVFSWTHIDQHNLTISGNTIDGTTAVYPAIYIYAWDDVAPDPNLDGVLIENNLVTATGTAFEVYLRDIGAGLVTNARVTANSLPSLRNRTAATIDATGNWWGTSSGPAPAQISGPLTTDPWITCYVDDPAHAGRPGFWPLPCSPQMLKANAVDDLTAMLGTPGIGREDAKRIQKAIEEITKSLDPKYWETAATLDPKDGDKVFDREAKAVAELAKIVKDGSPLAGAVQAVIDTMVEIDRGLAGDAIAAAAGGDQHDLDKALKQFQDGDAELAKGPGHEDNAIRHYREAWKHAQKALD